MTESMSARHILPFLVVSQAQKEVTHNEALLRIDALLHVVAENLLASPPTILESDAGKCWIIDTAGTGEWAGNSNEIASWTGGSWRYLVPTIGMRVWCRAAESEYFWDGDEWISAPEIDDPTGGTVIDVEARYALATLLQYLRASGRLAP